eukprot:13040_1
MAEYPFTQDTEIEKFTNDNIHNDNYVHGFTINDDLRYLCDSPNKRADWVTHIQHAIYELDKNIEKNQAVKSTVQADIAKSIDTRKTPRFTPLVYELNANKQAMQIDVSNALDSRKTSREKPQIAPNQNTEVDHEHKHGIDDDICFDQDHYMQCDGNCDEKKRICAVLDSHKTWIDRQKENNPMDINDYLHQNNIKLNTVIDDYHHCLLNIHTHFIDTLDENCDRIYKFSLRNNRDRNFNGNDTNEVYATKSLYFGYYRPREVYLVEFLDSVSCALMHNVISNSQYVLRKNRLQKKFVINVKNEKDNDVKIDSVEFGVEFRYYDDFKHHEYFVQPKHHTLKDELLSNPYYTLTPMEFSKYYLKTLLQMTSEFIKKMKLRNIGKLNHQADVRNDEPMRINHLLCMLTYTDNGSLQGAFKTTWRASASESPEITNKRHGHIYYWSKYLYELVFFYGKSMHENDTVYVGYNRELLFNQTQTRFCGPLSTSKSKIIANDYARDNGITFKLKRYDTRVNYFDASQVSRYSWELEVFFCSSVLVLTQYRIGFRLMDWGGDLECKAISLLRRILDGNLFIHKRELIQDSATVNTLIEFINNYQSCISSSSNDAYSVYAQKVFNFTMHSMASKQFEIWLNMAELQKLSMRNDTLCSYFYDFKKKEYGSLIKHVDIKTVAPNNGAVVQCELNEEQMIKLRNLSQKDGQDTSNTEIQFGEFTIVNNTATDAPLKFTFYLLLKQSQMHGNEEKILFLVCLKSLDNRVKSLEASWDLFIVEFYPFELHAIPSNFGVDAKSEGLHVFPKEQCLKLQTLTIRFSIRLYHIHLHSNYKASL